MKKNKKPLIYPAGTLILFTHGCHSLYEVNCLVRVVAEFDMTQAEKDYLSEPYNSNNPEGFPDWLIERGVVKAVECRVVHCGCFETDINDETEYHEGMGNDHENA